jgi:hypothetical protein
MIFIQLDLADGCRPEECGTADALLARESRLNLLFNNTYFNSIYSASSIAFFSPSGVMLTPDPPEQLTAQKHELHKNQTLFSVAMRTDESYTPTIR